MLCKRDALVAQLDRVFDYESKGRGFESLPARQINRIPIGYPVYFFRMRAGRDSKQAPNAARNEAGFGSKRPVDGCVKMSQRKSLPVHRYCLLAAR